jgi:hypothetical protein
MKRLTTLVLLVALGFSAMGCSSLKKLTGQQDDSVLPGQREDILPPDQQVAKDPKVMGKNATECDPSDKSCVPPVDQESQTPQ